MRMNGMPVSAARDLAILMDESAKDLIAAGDATRNYRLYAYFERSGRERQQLATDLRRLVDQYDGRSQTHLGILHSVLRLMSRAHVTSARDEHSVVDALLKNEGRLAQRIEGLLAIVIMDPSLAEVAHNARHNIERRMEELALLGQHLRLA
jgi:tRNA A37 threonylcarbamoyladenosine modification protein TsaB